MTRVVFSTMKEVKKLEFSYCHCEEGAAVTDAAIHRVSGTRAGLSVRLLVHSGSPRPQGARDDKGGVFYHEGSEDIGVLLLSLRGGSGARDAAIHRVSGDLDGNADRFLRASGSPRAFGPRDDKGGWVCGEKRKNGQSLCFTLHPSIFSLLLLAFLETNTEAYDVGADPGGVGGALS
jgi:hypothetical protein